MEMNLKRFIKDVWRAPLRLFMKNRLHKSNFSIISANCIGGMMYHDVMCQFWSPTINLIIPQFIQFLENLSYYLHVEPIESDPTKEGYPVCLLDDIRIIGVHYPDCNSLIKAWKRRSARVNFDCIFVVATDNFLHNEDEEKRFDKLPYPKVCFTCHEAKYAWQVYLPEFSGADAIGDALRYCNIFGVRIFEKHFDYVEWLNEYESINCKS